MPHGIPSYDTFGRVFARLNPGELERCFQAWTQALATAGGGRLIAFDGKTIGRSFDKANGRASIHMVSAWCQANRLVLGQRATDEKSNEIKASPQLLALLDVTDAVVTIDAMGCRTTIARQIVEQGGHYVLQVKKNQDTLYERIKGTFDELTVRPIGGVTVSFHEDVDAGHGRIETRRLWTTDWTDWYAQRGEWAGLRSFVCVESERMAEGPTSTDRRYCITDLGGIDAPTMLEYVRGHWGIENQLHWSLDVAFREDTLRQRVGHSAENLSRIRRLALNLLRKDRTCRAGINGKRLQACLKEEYLTRLLSQGV
ncbi:MAG: ISAs1 family transposase [Planctomycetes bacterium]|nr:ISAs1 family transposase [Planctomycetota bacterium]